MKKIIKIIAGLTAIILISILLFVANALLGNPVSKAIAQRNAEKYIEKTYPNMDLKIERVMYSFKIGDYIALVKSPTSIDTHFDIDISLTGKILRDSYEDYVLSGWNTWQRIDWEYRKMTDKVFDGPNFPYVSHISFGSLEIKDRDVDLGAIGPSYGLLLKDLELDKNYDIKELARTVGHITLYIGSEEVTMEKACEILLDIRNIFDKENIPFYAIDFVLEEARNSDGTPRQVSKQIEVADFLYQDIYEEGLEDRFREAVEALEEYYEKEDAKRKELNES